MIAAYLFICLPPLVRIHDRILSKIIIVLYIRDLLWRQTWSSCRLLTTNVIFIKNPRYFVPLDFIWPCWVNRPLFMLIFLDVIFNACIYICIKIHNFLYIHITYVHQLTLYTNIYIHVYIYIYIYVYGPFLYTCSYVHTYSNIYFYLHLSIHISIHFYRFVYTFIYIGIILFIPFIYSYVLIVYYFFLFFSFL